MMQVLFDRLGIDYRQWKALVRTSFILLRRNPAFSQGINTGNSSRLAGLVFALLFYGVVGVLFAFIPAANPDPAVTASLILFPTSFLLASLVLLEFGATIIAPEDFAILSVQPVNSRTYFASRLSVVILFTLMFAAVLGLPAFAAYTGHHGIVVGLAWLLAATLNAIVTGMGMVLVYTGALKVIPYRRMKSIMGYVQMGMSFVVYGGFGLLSSKIGNLLGNVAAGYGWWWSLLPPAWFGALPGLAAGNWTLQNGVGLLAALTIVAFIIPSGAAKISLSYAESIARAASGSSEKSPPASLRPGFSLPFLRRSEDRAVAILIARQFRYDLKFKMTVLAIVPLTILYLYQGLQGGGHFYNPFQKGIDTRALGSSSLLYIAIILFPGILKDEIGRSDNFRAAWVFFSSPADRTKLVLAVKRVLTAYFLLPYLFALGFVFYYFFQNLLHVVMHEMVLILASQIQLQLMFMIGARLPFSHPRGIGEKTGFMAFILLLGPILLFLVILAFATFLYSNGWYYLLGTLILLGLVVILEKILRSRVERKVGRLEFAG
jgi:hypothetical protein